MENMEVSAEVHFAQKLASNEKKIRDRAIKRLQKYLSVRSNHRGLSDSDLLKIWKGLFYCMWMQDKPLIQEELSRRITNLLHCFKETHHALRFVKVYLETLSREWNGIDKLRLDKFMMMARDMLHETLVLMSKDDWPLDACKGFASAVTQHVMQPDKSTLPDGLKLHVADMFVDEIWKVPLSQMTSKKMVILLKPFIDFVLHSNKIELVKRIMSDVIYKTISTMSDKASEDQKSADRTGDDTKDAGTMESEDDGNEGQENMDVDGSEQEKQSFTLDLGLLLVVMFKLAGGKDIHAPNRAVVYKLVKKHSDIYDSIMSLMTSSKVTGQAKGEEPSDDGFDLHFLEDDGQATDHPHSDKRKKKKRKKKNTLKQTEHSNIQASTEVSDSNIETCDNKAFVTTGKASTKILHKKRKASDTVDIVQSKKQGPHISQTAVSNVREDKKSISKTPKKKSQEDTHNDAETTADSDKNLLNQSSISPKTNKKKRKHQEEDGESLQPAKKRTKHTDSSTDSLSVDHCQNIVGQQEDVTLNKKKKSPKARSSEINRPSASGTCQTTSSAEQVESEDANNNAKAKARSMGPKYQPVATPVELVVYPHCTTTKSQSLSPCIDDKSARARSPSPKGRSPSPKGRSPSPKVRSPSPKRNRKKNSVADKSGRLSRSSSLEMDVSEGLYGDRPVLGITNELPSAMSPLPTEPFSRHTSAEAGAGRKHRKPGDTVATKIVGELCTALGTPCNMVKKAIAMVTSQPATKSSSNVDAVMTPAPASTPSTKKKVIFDLRRNKASKFQDYLKSLQQQPESPFEPSKSPSAGILKSPAVSPPSSEASDTSIDDSLADSSVSSPGSKSKSKKRRKSRNAPGNNTPSPYSSSSPNRKGRKKSDSLWKKGSQTPTPPPKSKTRKGKLRKS